MQEQNTQHETYGLSAEVLKIVTPKDLAEMSLLSRRSVTSALKKMYQEKGMDWIRANKNMLQSQLPMMKSL